MSQSVLNRLVEVEVLEPQVINGLQIFGLRQPPLPPADYLTLDDALAQQLLEITEVSEGGSVPTLRLRNTADRRVFLMAGEQLIGAKQNRVLNTSIMIEQQSDIPIPVSCVEQGRWAYRSKQFGSTGTASHSKLRHLMSKSVSDSYRTTHTPRSNQGEVWGEVSRKLRSMDSTSESMALEQTFADHRVHLDSLVESVVVPEGCCGAAFAWNGRIIGVDLFNQPSTLARLWPKLIRSYGLDVLEDARPDGVPLDVATVTTWLKQAASSKFEPFPSAGLGEDVRIASEAVVGSSLVVEQHPIHIQLFAEARA